MPFLTESVYVKTWWKLFLGIKLNAQCYLPLGIPLICGRAAGWQIDVRALPVLFPAACVGILRRIDTVGAHCHFIPRPLNSCWVTAERAALLGICVPGWCWIWFQEMSVVLTKSSNLTIWRKDGQCQLFLWNLAHLQQTWHYLVWKQNPWVIEWWGKRNVVWCVLFHLLLLFLI